MKRLLTSSELVERASACMSTDLGKILANMFPTEEEHVEIGKYIGAMLSGKCCDKQSLNILTDLIDSGHVNVMCRNCKYCWMILWGEKEIFWEGIGNKAFYGMFSGRFK